MLTLNDRRWEGLEGGYRRPYDPRPALRRLAGGGNVDDAWQELWDELHHQGDVGEASYAALVALVDVQERRRDLDWNFYALVGCIETERHRKGNPALPSWLARAYERALQRALDLALADLQTSTGALVVRSALAVVALAKGQLELGALLGWLDESEITELVEDRLAWSELYARGDDKPGT